MEKTDQELVKEYLEGNKASLDALVDRYLPIIYRFCYRQTGSKEESNDIAQEVFVKAWKHLQRYNPNQSFKTWIMTIARNSAIDYLRKRRPIAFSNLDSTYTEETFADTLASEEPLPDELYERGEAPGVVNELMQSLSETQRTVIILRSAEELTFEEIAKIVKRPLNTVKSDYRRGLLTMRKALQDMPTKNPLVHQIIS